MSKNIDEIDLMALFHEIYRNKKSIIKVCSICFVIGIVIAFSLPKEYTSYITFASESDKQKMSGSTNALANMIGIADLGTDYGVNENIYPEILKSTPFVLALSKIPIVYDSTEMSLKTYILTRQKYPWWLFWKNKDSEDIDDSMLDTQMMTDIYVEMFKSKVSLKQSDESKLFVLESTFQDPIIAQTVVDSVLSHLQEYITNYRTSKTRHDVEMNKKMVADAKREFILADSLYGSIVDKNANLVTKSTMIIIDRFKNERDLKYNIYQQYASQLALSIIKLQEETPIATIIEPSKSPIAPSSPNKILIIALTTFLGGLAIVGKIITKKIIESYSNGGSEISNDNQEL